ncbi:MAG: hypothetical protein HY465_04155, partial [Deltaproteobacteria bacterium]|nr:hypothetical protein [Deltaproteobacteria bacterium]
MTGAGETIVAPKIPYAGLVGQLCGGDGYIVTDEIDEDLRGFLNDTLEPGEAALLTQDEVEHYLRIYGAEGLKVLKELAELRLTDQHYAEAKLSRESDDAFVRELRADAHQYEQFVADTHCQPRAPLFTETVRRDITQSSRPESFHSYDFALRGKSWRDVALGTPDKEFLDAVMLTVQYGNHIPGLANRFGETLSGTVIRGHVSYEPRRFVPPKRFWFGGADPDPISLK